MAHHITVYLALLFTVSISLSGCEPTKKEGEDDSTNKVRENSTEKPIDQEELALVSFRNISFSHKEVNCQENCSRVVVSYPEFRGPTGNQLNKLIMERIRLQVSDFVLEGKSSQTLQELSNTFIEGFQAFSNEFPDATTAWSIEMEIAVSYVHPEFISLSQVTHSFTGGAHTNSTTQLINITPAGKLIEDISFFIEDVDKLKDIAEQIFSARFGIKADQSLSDAGYAFENDRFALANNFGFTQTGMIIYYNSYEIGPYVLGPSEIVIPYEQISEIYRFDILQS